MTYFPQAWQFKIAQYKSLFNEIYKKNDIILYKVNHQKKELNE